MAFTDYPPTSPTTDIQAYDWLIQLTKGLDEVAAAANNGLYPGTSALWDGNNTFTLTTTTLTDTTRNWAVFNPAAGGGGAYEKRWTGWTQRDPTRREPFQFDLVLLNLYGDPWNWRFMLRVPINDQDWVDNGDGTFTSHQLIFPAIDTGVPWFPGLPYYTHYFIIRRGAGGVFTMDRVPEWPNDLTLEWAVPVSTTTTSITVSTRNWSTNEWTGKWVYYTAGGKVRCSQITSNDSTTLHFAAIATAPDVAVFGILRANGLYWRPEHQPGVPDVETASMKVWPVNVWGRWLETQDYYVTRHPDDSIGLASKGFPSSDFALLDVSGDPADTLHFDMTGGTGVENTDVDLFTGAIDTKDPPDWCYTPDLYKTWRGQQKALMDVCANFIPYRSDFYDGYGKFFINGMTLARFFWQAQVNAAHGITAGLILANSTTATGLSLSGITLSEPIEPDQLPIPVLVTMEKRTNWDHFVGPGPFDYTSTTETINTGELVATDLPAFFDGTNLIGDEFGADHQNQEVWFTWGPTRIIPNQFRYFYPKECFIPDALTDPPPDGEPPAAVPPTEAFPGNWTTRPESTQYLDFDEHGVANYPTAGNEINGADFIDGKLARYVGDNWDYPTTHLKAGTYFSWSPQYWDNFYEGKSQAEAGSRNWDTVASGTVTAVDDPLQFQDNAKNWWSGVLIGDAGEANHSGNVTSFSSTTITDSSHSGNRFWDGSTTGRWVGHWFQIWQPGNIGSGGTAGPLHLTERPITAYNSGTFTFTFPAISGLSGTYTDSSNGTHTGTTQYRIREPKWEKNRFQGAVCTLNRTDTGADLYGFVTYSANNRLRVDAWRNDGGSTVTYTPVVGDAYIVERVSTGTVWKWNAGTGVWEAPTGTDTRFGSSVTFPNSQWTIPPDHRRRYGRVMNGDYVGVKLHTELAKMRSALRMTIGQKSFVFTPDPVIDFIPASANIGEWFIDSTSGNYTVFTPDSGSTFHPLANANIQDGYCGNEAFRTSGYGQISINPGISPSRLRVPADGKWLTYAELDADFHDDGSSVFGVDYTFDANGDPVAYRTWKPWDNFSNSTDIEHTSALFGNGVTEPNLPTPSAGGTTIQGYYVRDSIVILDYGPYMNFIGSPPI